MRDAYEIALGMLGQAFVAFLLAGTLVGIAMLTIGAPVALCWWAFWRMVTP